MKIKINEQKLKYIVLMIIPFFIFVAVDGIFSVQSIIPAILLLVTVDLLNMKISKNKIMFLVVSFFSISTISSLLFNMLTNNGLTTNQTYIRILYYTVILYLYFSLTRVQYTSKQLSNIFNINIICGIIVSLYLILINHIWFTGLLGTVVDKNFIGAILAIQAEMAVIKGLKTEKSTQKILAVFCYGIIFLGIFYSASRASLLVCILGTLITMFFGFVENAKSKNEIIKLILKIFIIVGACFGVFYYLSNKMLNANQSIQWYWNRYFINGFGDDSVTGRWVWWKNALELWTNRPIFGYGIGNVNVSGNSSAVSHNTYIDFLLDQGILGFVGFFIVILRSISKVIVNHKKIYYGMIITILLNIMILSATRSTYMWYNLILIYCIGNSKNIDTVNKT